MLYNRVAKGLVGQSSAKLTAKRLAEATREH